MPEPADESAGGEIEGEETDDLFPPDDEDESAEDESESDEEPDANAGDEPEPGEDEGGEPPPDDEHDEPPIHLPDEPPAKSEKARGGAGVIPKPLAPTSDPTPLPEGRRALGLGVDIAVGVALAVGGALLGEFVVRKSTAAILREAGSAPKFPPTDLLVWLACVAFPLLVLVLFANRGKSVGNWLRRRSG